MSAPQGSVAECRTAPLSQKCVLGTFSCRSHSAETAINLCAIRFPPRMGLHQAGTKGTLGRCGSTGTRHRAVDGWAAGRQSPACILMGWMDGQTDGKAEGTSWGRSAAWDRGRAERSGSIEEFWGPSLT